MKKIVWIACVLATGCQTEAPKKEGTLATSTPVVAPAKVDTMLGTKPAAPATPAVTAAPVIQCFEEKVGKDVTSVSLKIAADSTVTGTYDWVPFQKDGGRGTLKGKLAKDSTITADWDYVIEGSNQVEQVVLKVEKDVLKQKQGELTETNLGSKKVRMVIKNPAKAKFSKTFKKVDCKK